MFGFFFCFIYVSGLLFNGVLCWPHYKIKLALSRAKSASRGFPDYRDRPGGGMDPHGPTNTRWVLSLYDL